ncbi:MAG: DNA-3-methyladenine glycosylase family protein [Gammaproteobacteria bacterium]|tara:strand:+ start:108 stop:734 length:627 start_codon:yes stop_codon:yes gene_type:complete
MKEFKTLNNKTLQEGFSYLANKEPKFKKILEEKNYEINPFSKQTGFEGLISLIVEQQLSVASAKAIFGRVKSMVKPFNPIEFLKIDPRKFKAAGLSKQKIDYCFGIANKIINKELDLEGLTKKEDSEVTKELVKIRGIGEWTAQCYLMACLKRLDAWPASDLGLIVAIQRIKGLNERPDYLTIEKMSEPWSPYRSIAALILWSTYDKE